MPDARSPAGARVVRFGEVEADLGAGEVRRGGSRIVLGEQPLRILLRLIERPGETVTRDELRRELWPGNTFVDFEHGLNSAIKRLRDALGDSADAPRYVKTLPRRGYRFIAPIDNGLPATLSPSGAAGELTRPGPTVLSRRVVVGALLVASAATVAGWLALGPSRSRPSVSAVTPAATTATNLVAVAAFDNRTADPSLAPLGPLTAGRLIRAIGRVESAAVHPEPIRTGSKAVPSGVGEDPVPVAGRLGAALAVAGAYYLRGDRVEFQARIVDARTGKLLYSAPPAAARAEPAAALEEIEQAIAGAVAIHFDQAFGGLEITSVPPLLDAYLEYQAGRELFERDYTRLVAHLQRAIAISPNFVLARLTLAMAHDNLGDGESVADEMARIADGADRLTKAERMLVEYLTESLARRPAHAVRVLHDLEKLAPHSWIVNYSLQMEALILNRPAVAIDAFARLPLHERYHRFNGWRLGALARALHQVGDYERELKEIRRAQAYEPGNLRYAAGEARALAALKRLDQIPRALDRSVSVPSSAGSPGNVMEQAALELRAHRHREASLAVAARAVDWFRTRAPAVASEEANRAALARVLYLADRLDESQAAFAALATDHPGSIEYAGYLGTIAARQGRSRDALDISNDLRNRTTPNLYGRHTYWRACIAALLGERERAVDLLREALGEGHYLGLHIHQSPHLEPLRDFAPFVELAAPREE